MRIYGLTNLGYQQTNRRGDIGEEMKVLHYIRDNKTATSDELETVAEGYVIRSLVRRGLAKELTT